MSSFVAALRLLTTVPVGWSIGTDARAIARSPVFFPVIGLGIGLALAGADHGLSIFLSGGVAAALIVGGGVALTGGLHLDGLADTADALGGGRTAKRRLEIMRDPSIGTFGAAAVGLSLLLRWASIAALLGTPRFAVIAIAPLLGRWAALLLVDVFRYIRPNGLGSPYVDAEGFGESAPPNSPLHEIGEDSGRFGGRKQWPEDRFPETRGQKSPQTPLYERGDRERSVPSFRLRTGVGGAFTLAITFALLGPWGLLAFGIGSASAVFLGKYAASRLGGGVTGDVYGAANEVAEIAALIALVGLSRGDLLTIPVWI